MGTLVQKPDVAQGAISGLQAIDRPTGEQGLGTFLSSLLPAVSAGLSTYDQETKQRNIALGMNDALNDVHREMSFLDRKNYLYGVNYQHTVSGQLGLAKKFKDDVEAFDPETGTVMDLHGLGNTYLRESVDNIFNANIPQELKESLYQTQLKENATYMQMVNTRMQQITADAEYKTRLGLTSQLAVDLRNKSYDEESIKVRTRTFIDGVVEGMRGAHADAPMSELQDEARSRLKAAYTNAMDDLRASGTAEDAQRLALLEASAESMVHVDLDIATYIQQKASGYRTEIYANNEAYNTREISQVLSSWDLNPAGVTKEKFNGIVAEVAAMEGVGEGWKTEQINRLTSGYTSSQKALVAGEKLDIKNYESASAYEGAGKTKAAWASDWLEELQKQNPDNPFKAGYELVQKGTTGSEYSPEAVKLGSDVMFRTLAQYVQMNDAQVMNDPIGAVRQENFKALQQIYTQAKSGNTTAATDLLSSLDDNSRHIYAAVLGNGGTLEDVRNAFKNPIAASERMQWLNNSIDNLDVKHLDLRKEIFGGIGGTRFRNMNDNIEELYRQHFQGALRGSRSQLLPNVASSRPQDLVSAVKDQVTLASPGGYSATIRTVQMSKDMANWKVSGTNEPLGPEFIGKAIDAQRETLAKKLDVQPDNIIAKFDESGQNLELYAYKIEGSWGGIRTGEAKLVNVNQSGIFSGGEIPTARIKADAEKLYQGAKVSKQSKGNLQAEFDRKGGTRVGKVASVDLSNGKSYNLHINSLYADAMGGNLNEAIKFINHLQQYEGFTSNPKQVTDTNSKKSGYVYGMGMRTEFLTDKTKGMLEQGRGNQQRVMDIQGGVMRSHFENLNINKDIQTVGIPIPTSGPYPEKYSASLQLLYDVGWHGHNGGLYGTKKNPNGVVKAMNAPTYAEGLAILKKTSVYDRSVERGERKYEAKRNAWMRNALKKHFEAKGK